MKNTALGIILIMILCAAGCGKIRYPALKEPPALTVTAGDTSVQAIRSTYSWQDGKTGIEADGPHPLDMLEKLPVIEVPDDGSVTLVFDPAPDRVTVFAWKTSAAGIGNYSEPELSLPVSAEQTVTLPADDRYLYEVHAFWDNQNDYGGDAYYGFASAPGK